MKPSLYGVDGADALFEVGEVGVIVNTRTLTAHTGAFEDEAFSRFWVAPPSHAPVQTWSEIAAGALSAPTEVAVVATGAETRAYTVPKAVARQAAGALSCGMRLGPVTRRAATMLSTNKQVQLRDVAWVHRFFSRNTAEGAGVPRWDAWGHEHGRMWSSQIVSKNLTAATEPSKLELSLFSQGDETSRAFWVEKDPENGELAVNLFTKSETGTWLAWGDGEWFDCEAPAGQFVEVDDDTALYVAAALFDAPDTPVSLRDQDPEEWDVTMSALSTVDWEMIDRVMTPEALRAAGEEYTPEERSANASQQPRDANGRFAKVGDTGRMKSGMHGTIRAVNPVDNSLVVEGSDGQMYPVPANEFEIGGAEQGPGLPEQPGLTRPLNLDGILGQPRATASTPKAWLKRLLQPMGAGQLKQVISDYEGFINRERQQRGADFEGGTGWSEKPPRRRNRTFALEDGEAPETPDEGDQKPTPENTDVKPLYLAIVDRDDPRAVMELVAMVPASSTESAPTAFRRVGGEWVEDVAILADMRSPTPPPVVQLTEQDYQDVLRQVDAMPSEEDIPEDAHPSSAPDPAPAPAAPAAPAPAATPTQAPAPVAASGDVTLGISMEPATVFGWDENGDLCAVVAAGGLDRNRGNAEKLRRYWLYGKGAAKIRWGTGGDWRRCVRYLSKYLGPRAKGYCALRHKEATGMWTGDKAHRAMYNSAGEWVGDLRHEEKYSLTASADPVSSRSDIRRTPEVIRASADAARRQAALMRVYGLADQITPVPQDAAEIEAGRAGRAFKIPLVIPEGIESGDGRTFEKGSLSMRSFPLPLMWQVKTGDGHDGAFVCGRVDRVERMEDGLGNAYGVFDTGPYGQEAQRLVENKMLRFVSADLDRFEADEQLADDTDDEKPGGIKEKKLRIKKGRLMGITLVPKPAFQECTIELVPLEEVSAVPRDGAYQTEEVVNDEPIVASAKIAASIPLEPPKVWFERPVLNGPTPITVTDEGQLFGHIATWGQDHIGLGRRAPHSASNYAYFHTGVVRTNDGVDVPVGQLTLAGGHADLTADAYTAVKHYDDTGSAIADVHAGEDAFGIWVAGAVRPGTTPEQVRALRASAPSGDWRVINNRLELVAVCQVNVPGFPVPRAQVASGMVASLVAAGTGVLAELRKEQHKRTDDEQLALLNEAHQRELRERTEAALARVKPARESREQLESLAAAASSRVFRALDADGYLTEFKTFSPERREKLAKEKKALKDGSFPIENGSDLRRAIQAYGRASDDKKASVRRHIVRRARALGKTNLIPDDWSEASLNDLALNRHDAKEAITAATLARRAEQLRKTVRGDTA